MTFFELARLLPSAAACLVIIALVLGAVFGSFINCVAWRIVAGESPWKGRSHCAACGHELGVLDLIPVLSWLFLRGKCRYCGDRVSPRYLLTELLCAIYFASIVVLYGLTLITPFLLVLGVCLLGLSLVDLETYTIPNGFIIVGIVAWAIYAIALFATGNADALTLIGSGLLGGFAIGLVVLLLSLVMDKVLGRQSMGGGDIKLLFVVGLYLGLGASVFNLIIACVVGIVFALASNSGRGKAFPFGPSIALATWVTLLVGQYVLAAYLSLF